MPAPVVVQEHAVFLVGAAAEYPVSVHDAPVVEVPGVGAVLAGHAVLRPRVPRHRAACALRVHGFCPASFLRSLSALLKPHAPRPMRAAAAAAIAMLSDEQQKKPAMNAPAEAYSSVFILFIMIPPIFLKCPPP